MIAKGKPEGFGFERGVELVRSDSEILYQGAQSKTRKTLLLLLQIVVLLAICRTRPCLLFGGKISLNAVHHETRQHRDQNSEGARGLEASDGLNQLKIAEIDYEKLSKNAPFP